MRIYLFFLAATCLSCGTQDRFSEPNRMQYPCHIKLSYEKTMVQGSNDHPHYLNQAFSENCKEYVGEGIQTLRYRLDVKAKESVGVIEQISIDGRRMFPQQYSLSDLTVVDDVDSSYVDNGPIQLEYIWVSFAFPSGSEKSLYPSSVELTISKKR